MLVYPKIAREVLLIRAIFILGCGCDVKNLVQPCWLLGKKFLQQPADAELE